MVDAWTRGWSRLLCLVLLGLGVSVTPALAQEEAKKAGKISGVVVDKKNGKSLPGANVSIKGNTTGTPTDVKGRYRLTGLEPGTYDILFSFVGFQEKTVTDVKVKPGETTTLDITLAEKTAQMEEVVGQAQAARDTEAGLMKDRVKAAAVSNAIGAEAMSAAGAGTAASAMKKVTGASVVEGKYVIVRGLGGRYSKTMMDGVDLPSADPESKSVPLDLFPTDLISNIKTVKTFTPDQPGDFSGGLVDISTKSYPEEFRFSASASTTINPQVQFGGGFISHSSDQVNMFGFSGDGLSVPSTLSGLSADQIPSQPVLADNPQQYSQISKALGTEMGPQSASPPVNQSYSLSLGNQSEVGGRPLGYVFGVTFDRKASFYDDGTTGRYQLTNGGESITPIINLQDRKASTESSIGGIANLTYKLTPDHEIGLNTLYTHKGETTTRFQQGEWSEAGSEDVLTNRSLLFTERDVLTVNLHGNSLLKELGNVRVKWNGAYATTSQKEPDRRFWSSVADVRTSGDTVYTPSPQNLREPSRLFRELNEDRYSGKVDFTIPFEFSDRESEFKFGGRFSYTTRDFSQRFFSYNRPDAEANISFDGSTDSYFADQNIGIVGQDSNGDPIWGITVSDQTSPTDSYDGENTIGAGYAMADVPVTKDLRAIGGLRVETTDLSVRASPSPDDQGAVTKVDFLPSLNLVYSLTDDMNLRAAASQTLARPTFREIAPFAGFNFIQGTVFQGNTNLKRTLIKNLDFRWEWFPRAGEVIAASVYYKNMDQPIEQSFISTSSNTGTQASWKNVPNAEVYGAECEARLRLDYLSETLKDFTFGGNLSLTESQISVPCQRFETDQEKNCLEGELFFRQKAGESSTRDLQGQSPYLLNLDLQYDNPESGTSAGLFYSVFGERLSVVSSGTTPDVFTQPRPELSASVSQTLLEHWTVKVEASNLLNSANKETYAFEGEEAEYQSYNTGRSYSLGISYSTN